MTSEMGFGDIYFLEVAPSPFGDLTKDAPILNALQKAPKHSRKMVKRQLRKECSANPGMVSLFSDVVYKAAHGEIGQGKKIMRGVVRALSDEVAEKRKTVVL